MNAKRSCVVAIVAGAVGIDCSAREASLGSVAGQDHARISIASKVDVLLVVDDSGSMDDKHDLLAKTVPDFVDRLLRPYCVDASGKSVGRVTDGVCNTGRPEFRPVDDLHVGITGTSLPIPGNQYSLCEPKVEGGGRFRAIGKDRKPNARASTTGFLSWQRGDDETALKADISDIVLGMGSEPSGIGGCGYEAPLESWYRLLVEPDPYETLSVPSDTRQLQYSGIDETILATRKAFMRPDSMLVIAMVGDEDDNSLDVGGYDGTGWRAATSEWNYWPTSSCLNDPFGPACTSCAFGTSPTDPNCSSAQGSAPDWVNTRFFEPKRHLGVDPLFALDRYTSALTSYSVPSLAHRQFDPNTGAPIETADCVNPIFAAELPGDASGDLCHLKAGVRDPSLVRFAVIGGVPRSLIANDPTDPNSLERAHLGAADWLRLTGQDPEHYNYAGADPHMIPSRAPRAGLPGPTSSNIADPIHGREHETTDRLQAACAYALAAPPAASYSCGHGDSPLCEAGKQVRASAEPPTRLLTVARSLGDRSIVSSICPTLAVTATPLPEESPAFGFKPAFHSLGESMAPNLVK